MAKYTVTPEQKAAKRKALMGTLEAGIAECRDSDRFREWLTTCSKFHKYSWGNTMLIMMQKPDASQVAGFQTWRKMKRCVRKGERGIQILAPRPYKRTEENEEGDEETHEGVYFRAVHVFDVSQTDGDELPTPLDELAGMDDAGLFAKLDNMRDAEGLSISREEGEGPNGANGSYTATKREIWIRPDVSLVQATKTYAHELAHHFAEHGNNGHCREEAETIAESVAFVVLGHYSIDAGAYSFGYLASWTDDKTFKSKLGEIQKIASKMIETIG